ncbi:LysR family transcriptional regulator [Luteimonas fraxinea]|uniref:LysR family transcriptional regulator n=1 Tax=Luteimonas fraxinea TaxID=2901869 RepID=A0ABS8UDH0_9GAMM|nr:LysR family transcriptional regulator [Luteimonas fraxinea]MCD9096791.1 LysR family transcriptional regulator [Luteimonas fraxinea]MCD9126159.1 LysR family transcriptional regulator [Luteimonas fraxinea]UHH09860.1 LysR family transcriptional regulator [Luteimonas fraxinea]
MKSIHQSKGNDLAAFAAFLAVAAHRSFRSAASELNMTPSAISHSIKVLEQRLNVRLFNRTTRSVSLTEAGERLALKLRPAMASIEEAVQELEVDEHVPSGTVRINASEGAIRLTLWPVLARFLREYPRVHIDIFTDGRLGDIVADGFDAGIRLAEAVPKDMVAIPVMGEVRFAALASPGYLEQHGHPRVPQDLYDHNCIRFRFESGAIYRWEFERQGVVERINPSGSLTLTDQPLMVEASIDGIGIAFVPDHLAVNALNDGRLKRLLEDWCPAYPGLCLYYVANRHLPSGLRALINMMTGMRSDS